MPPQQRSPWIYVLGILFLLLIVVVVLVLRASKKIAPTSGADITVAPSDFMKKDSGKTPVTYVPNTTTTTTSTTVAGQAIVSTLDVQVLESFPVQVTAVVGGNLSDPCTTLGQPVVTYTASTKKFSIFTPTSRPASPTTACADVLVPYTKSIPLNVSGLSAGMYTVSAGTQTKTFILDTDNTLDISSGK